MKGLLLRLATHEADAETCVRVIAYFDALVERRASPEALVRATSGEAKCSSGLQLGDDQMWRFSPGATPFIKDASNATVRTEFDVNGRPACSSRTSRRYVRLEFREVVLRDGVAHQLSNGGNSELGHHGTAGRGSRFREVLHNQMKSQGRHQ